MCKFKRSSWQYRYNNCNGTFIFSTKTNTIYAKSQSSKITVTEVGEATADAGSYKYVWVLNNQKPTNESEYKLPYANKGDAIKSDGTGDNWYLAAIAKDKLGNTTTAITGPFYLDNTSPTTDIPSASATTNSITVILAQTDVHSKINTTKTQYGYRLKNATTWNWVTDSSTSHTFNSNIVLNTE